MTSDLITSHHYDIFRLSLSLTLGVSNSINRKNLQGGETIGALTELINLNVEVCSVFTHALLTLKLLGNNMRKFFAKQIGCMSKCILRIIFLDILVRNLECSHKVVEIRAFYFITYLLLKELRNACCCRFG